MKIAGYENIPIDQLDATRKNLREQGIKFRVYFRGPRASSRKQDTLKEDAVAFTVYEAQPRNSFPPGRG